MSSARVCPFCGDPPGDGVFCAACGRNLAAVERLPTREEWEGAQPGAASQADPRPLTDRCAEATAAFLAAMHASEDPGAVKTPIAGGSGFRRTRHAHGWVLRPVERDEELPPRRYEPGLVLTVEGRFHRLNNEIRGWGQRDFPQFHHTVEPDPIEMPADERLIADLAAVLRENGL
jgi:hypothetical protein